MAATERSVAGVYAEPQRGIGSARVHAGPGGCSEGGMDARWIELQRTAPQPRPRRTARAPRHIPARSRRKRDDDRPRGSSPSLFPPSPPAEFQSRCPSIAGESSGARGVERTLRTSPAAFEPCRIHGRCRTRVGCQRLSLSGPARVRPRAIHPVPALPAGWPRPPSPDETPTRRQKSFCPAAALPLPAGPGCTVEAALPAGPGPCRIALPRNQPRSRRPVAPAPTM